jgi:transposase
MKLSEHDLRQIDERYVNRLTRGSLLSLTCKLLDDVKTLHERLNQNPQNSSVPPSSQQPWLEAADTDDDDDEEKSEHEKLKDLISEEQKGKDKDRDSDDTEQETSNQQDAKKKKAGKQPGAPGVGRTQKLPITETIMHKAQVCGGCSAVLSEEDTFVASTGHYTVDINYGSSADPGITVTNTKHIYGDITCSCGHVNHTEPFKLTKDERFNVDISQWHLVGPQLISLIVFLAKYSHMSRSKIKEFLFTWLGLSLSKGTINKCIHEAGRSVAPLKQQIVDELLASKLIHIDETPWKEKGNNYWLWIFTSASTCFFTIGSRSKENVREVLPQNFSGFVMSDGYNAYRDFTNRVRCWAHLIRKARGLKECFNKEAASFGCFVLNSMNYLIDEVYDARKHKNKNLLEKHRVFLRKFKEECEKHTNCIHDKASALAREFLNDWDAIFHVLSSTDLPLTNNEAERALRPWVILRRLSYGTRTPQGSQVFSLLISVIGTCVKRAICPWKFIANVVAVRRQGLAPPALPRPDQALASAQFCFAS